MEIDPTQGFCIEVSCLPDGTFNVSVESLEQEAAEPGEQPGIPAKSFDEALAAASQMYAQMAGEQGEPQSAETPQEDAGEGFEQGFSGVRGAGLGR